MKGLSDTYDFIVVGSGAAGLFCAIRLSQLGMKVCVLTKSKVDSSSTNLAQGGIAVALPENDTPDAHLKDTVKAGAGLVEMKSARILVEEGVKRVIDLMRMGVRFDKDKNGIWDFTREAAHSIPRIVHFKDETGREVERALIENYRGKLVENAHVREILVKNNRVYGVVYKKGKETFKAYAPIVAIATGGASGIYLKSTNPQSTGDGIAMALRYGARLKDLEFVQFHPTAFCDNNDCFLISESVRGEGGILVDRYGKRFMGDYHPSWELAPRDVVSRSIESQMKLTNGRIYLDFKPIEKRGINIKDRFPGITQKLEEKGFNPQRDLIPITPVAHYYMGGIDVDTFGRTSIKGLFAIGEASCTGVHGANRLASNSLLECVVFGERAAYGMYRDYMYLANSFEELDLNPKLPKEKNKNHYSMEDIRETMWNYVGIVRSARGLSKAIEKLSNIAFSGSTWKVKNAAILGLSIAVSAMRREESRGGHYRSDFPYERQEFRFHSKFTLADLQKLS